MFGSSKTSRLPWQLQVFAVSVRKKEKWYWVKPQIQRVLRNVKPKDSTLRCLDVGSGVGTLSIFMEQLGGDWNFTENDHAAAEETRKIVRGPVYEIDIFDSRLQPATYHLITVFDVIEHVPDPGKFMRRLYELLTPGGAMILTTPADKHGYYLWRRLAEKVFGIDKAAHGHVVEGFSSSELKELIRDSHLQLQRLNPFSFFFTELVELAYNGAYILKNRAKQSSTPGYNLALSPASGHDVSSHLWQLQLLKIAYPILRAISLLDHIITIPPGYEWGLVAHRDERVPR